MTVELIAAVTGVLMGFVGLVTAFLTRRKTHSDIHETALDMYIKAADARFCALEQQYQAVTSALDSAKKRIDVLEAFIIDKGFTPPEHY